MKARSPTRSTRTWATPGTRRRKRSTRPVQVAQVIPPTPIESSVSSGLASLFCSFMGGAWSSLCLPSNPALVVRSPPPERLSPKGGVRGRYMSTPPPEWRVPRWKVRGSRYISSPRSSAESSAYSGSSCALLRLAPDWSSSPSSAYRQSSRKTLSAAPNRVRGWLYVVHGCLRWGWRRGWGSNPRDTKPRLPL